MSYSWACDRDYKDKEVAWNVVAALLFRPFCCSRVPQVAVGAAAVVRSKKWNDSLKCGYV